MVGNKTTARRTRRTATTRPAPVAAAKEPAKAKVTKPRVRAKAAEPTAAAVEDLQRWVEMAAYFRAERRGFEPGRELEDWFAAEAEIEAQLVPAPKQKTVRRPRKTDAT